MSGHIEDIMQKREKWFQEYYGQLEGYSISKFDGMKDTDGVGEDGFASFILHKAGHPTMRIEVSKDEEGNGGGFMFISEYKLSKKLETTSSGATVTGKEISNESA